MTYSSQRGPLHSRIVARGDWGARYIQAPLLDPDGLISPGAAVVLCEELRKEKWPMNTDSFQQKYIGDWRPMSALGIFRVRPGKPGDYDRVYLDACKLEMWELRCRLAGSLL